MGQNQKGIIFSAIGELQYLEAALISIFTLRSLDPSIPIVLVTNFSGLSYKRLQQLSVETEEIFIPKSLRSQKIWESRLIKTLLFDISKFQNTLYLDADIFTLNSISSIWDFLVAYQCCMCIDMLPTLSQCSHISTDEKSETLKVCDEYSDHFNSGVLLWRKTTETRQLFYTWRKEWERFRKHDQLALLRAIKTTRTPINKLPYSYNYPYHWFPLDLAGIEPLSCLSSLKDQGIYFYHCFGGRVKRGHFKEISEAVAPEATQYAELLMKESLLSLIEKPGGKVLDILSLIND